MFRFPRIAGACAAVLVVLVAAAPVCGEIRYSVLDLGSLGGTDSETQPFGVNDLGQVVGYSTSLTGGYHEIAFRTQPNAVLNPLTDNLGTLGGSSARALGINNLGAVTGYSTTPSGYNHAFRTGPNQPINPATDDLGTLGGTTSQGHAINDLGQVTGYAYTPSDAQRHVFKTGANAAINPATDDIHPSNSGESYGLAINNAGHVAGYAYATGNSIDPWAFRASGVVNPATDNLGQLSLPGVIARAMNEPGQVTGAADVTGPVNHHHAFLTAPGGAITPGSDIGTIPANRSQAYGINDDGDVVGWSEGFAFYYDATDGMLDLNTLIDPALKLRLIEARDINNLGQIVVWGRSIFGGPDRAYLLTPVPEPASATSIVTLAAAALIKRRRAHRARG